MNQYTEELARLMRETDIVAAGKLMKTDDRAITVGAGLYVSLCELGLPSSMDAGCVLITTLCILYHMAYTRGRQSIALSAWQVAPCADGSDERTLDSISDL